MTCSQTLPASQQKTWVAEIKQKFGDDIEFLTKFNPARQVEFVQKHFDRCFTGDAPSLTRVRGTYGQGTAEAWLTVQLADLAIFSGIKEKPEAQQIAEIAKIIMSNYQFLKVTEIMVFMNRFKAGKIDINGRKAQFYGQFDGLIITAAMSEFVKYRREVIEKIEKNQRNNEK